MVVVVVVDVVVVAWLGRSNFGGARILLEVDSPRRPNDDCVSLLLVVVALGVDGLTWTMTMTMT